MAERIVEIAVDAPGVRGGQTLSYRVPASLAHIGIGDAVVVEYGRQATVGVVLGDSGPEDDVGLVLRTGGPTPSTRQPAALKSVLDRIGDESLLPPLTARLVRFVASHYLAPPGMVVRQALPSGHFEEIEVVAYPPDAPAGPAFGVARAVDPVRAGAPKPATRLERELLSAIDRAPDGLSRDQLAELPEQERDLDARLGELAERDLIKLRWRFPPPRPRARQDRFAILTEAGREAADALDAGERLQGRPLGPRQAALLSDLAARDSDEPAPAARLAEEYGGSAVLGLARRGFLELSQRSRLPEVVDEGRRIVQLTSDSEARNAARNQVVESVERRSQAAYLLEAAPADRWFVHGAAIDAALAVGLSALVLVPEIALARPMLDRLPAGTPVALIHSGLTEGERADAWQRIRSGAARVVVGTRLAVLAPLADVGVVIVEEEQDTGYKSDRTPRYQARDVALELGRLGAAPVILGSATPDFVSTGRARRGELVHVRLLDRARERPQVEIVDLRDELATGNRGLLSSPLVDAVGSLDTAAGEQAIVVLNRRGSASVVLCRDCGYVQVCPECERPLVFHAAQMALRCHHCGATAPVARRCPACGSVRIRYLGGGTQRVEHELSVQFPQLRVARLDRDVIDRRGTGERILRAFADRELDVLVGTALVTKGLDAPRAPLIAVVSADIALSLPDDRAAERTWQQLEQAVGRAGSAGARVLIQTYRPDHPVLEAVATGDASSLIDAELERRRRFGSPPNGSLIKLTVALEDRDAAERAARDGAEQWRERARGSGVAVLGPVPAYVARRSGRWRFHVVLRGDDPRAVLGPDPGSPWSIDVDPESLL